MKKHLIEAVLKCCLLLVALLPAVSSATPTLSDRIVLADIVYGNVDVSFFAGNKPSATFIAPIAVGSVISDLFLTEPGSFVISDHLYTGSGCNALLENDCLYFSSDALNDPTIGTICDPNVQQCLAETGALQDVSSYFNLGGTFFTLQVQSKAPVPEPASLALLGTGLAGLALIKRKKA